MNLKGVIATGFFRTGSTFFFSSLREVSKFRCYYEPYHPELLDFVENLGEIGGGPNQEVLGHSVGDDYFKEFESINLIELSRVFNLKRRNTNQPVLLPQSQNSDLMAYIKFLAEDAYEKQQIPLLQANRFNFALPWLKRVFPEYLLVLITREPQSVFKSLRSLAKNEGLELSAKDSKSDYWNVKEAFENIVKIFGFELEQIDSFGYYQKLYFILRFSERAMAEHADLVVDYEQFLNEPETTLQFITRGFDLDPQPAINYVNKNAKIGKPDLKDEALSLLEREVSPFLNYISKQASCL